MNILIVEDDIACQGLILTLLRPLAITEPRTCRSLSTAISFLSGPPKVDLIVLDLYLLDTRTEKDTIDKIPLMKQLQPECALVVLSGMLFKQGLREMCEQAGADVVTDKDEVICRKDILLTAFLKALKLRKVKEPNTPEYIHQIRILEEAINIPPKARLQR